MTQGDIAPATSNIAMTRTNGDLSLSAFYDKADILSGTGTLPVGGEYELQSNTAGALPDMGNFEASGTTLYGLEPGDYYLKISAYVDGIGFSKRVQSVTVNAGENSYNAALERDYAGLVFTIGGTAGLTYDWKLTGSNTADQSGTAISGQQIVVNDIYPGGTGTLTYSTGTATTARYGGSKSFNVAKPYVDLGTVEVTRTDAALRVSVTNNDLSVPATVTLQRVGEARRTQVCDANGVTVFKGLTPGAAYVVESLYEDTDSVYGNSQTTTATVAGGMSYLDNIKLRKWMSGFVIRSDVKLSDSATLTGKVDYKVEDLQSGLTVLSGSKYYPTSDDYLLDASSLKPEHKYHVLITHESNSGKQYKYERVTTTYMAGTIGYGYVTLDYIEPTN